MTTMQAIGAHQECYVYYGDRPRWLVALAVTRDSDALERSNFRVIERDLRSRFGTSVDVERNGHWLCGWIDKLIVDPTDVLVVNAAHDWRSKLEDYLVADEEDFSSLEDEELEETKAEITRLAGGHFHTVEWTQSHNGDPQEDTCTCQHCDLSGIVRAYGGDLTSSHCVSTDD